ncbi:putative E3 ubiquitin ligase complex SCF subunit sconB [Termitomyces sp. T112]|nr:putative E3 ubiquitin ligase complex SCF subunit sconB [Termitomyces sp. T112]
MSAAESYVCDTLPAPKLAADHDVAAPRRAEPTQEATPRKLCFRHQRMADEGTNLKLQQALDAMPLDDRQAVNAIWSSFSSSSHPCRALILQGLLTMCCFSQLSLLTEHLAHLIRIDPFACFPREVSLKILGYLDATSLCRAAQVARRWRALADDDVLWRGICEQHIGQKCTKCGWGLPVLEKKRGYRPRSLSPPIDRPQSSKRAVPEDHEPGPPIKRQRSSDESEASSCDQASSCVLLTPIPSSTHSLTRPWKDVYSERMTIERNWRRGRCTARTLKGHTDGVMCLQFHESLSYPAFPVLISGSYDRTVRVWNMETGVELHTLKGHTRAIRALQFDDIKLITGSMDHTLKVWDWRRGKCIRTLAGHTNGVLCLNFDSNVLASGSVDTTIKVWNLRTGGAFTLRGHSDWVNAVQLWDSNPSARTEQSSVSLFDVPGGGSLSPRGASCSATEIDAGKMLFSASDDGTIKLWDLTLRTCLRTMTGHMGQVQSMKLLPASDCDGDELPVDVENSEEAARTSQPSEASSDTTRSAPSESPADTTTTLFPNRKKAVLISGSLDNTIRLWDIETGKCTRTFFGHIEGVWAVACDKMRLVSGSHDRTVKVWSREEGKCTATLVGHKAAVSCLALGEDKIVSGSDDADIKIWSFSG